MTTDSAQDDIPIISGDAVGFDMRPRIPEDEERFTFSTVCRSNGLSVSSYQVTRRVPSPGLTQRMRTRDSIPGGDSFRAPFLRQDASTSLIP